MYAHTHTHPRARSREHAHILLDRQSPGLAGHLPVAPCPRRRIELVEAGSLRKDYEGVRIGTEGSFAIRSRTTLFGVRKQICGCTALRRQALTLKPKFQTPLSLPMAA